METVQQIVALAVIGAVLGGIGIGLAWLNAAAVGLSWSRWPPRPLPLFLFAPPALAWAGMCFLMLALMAGDPTAANLWPLTVMLMAVLWLAWIAAAWALTAVLRRLRRG